jgi:hypothetical protein
MARTPMRRSRGDDRNSYARRDRDFPYMGFIKTQRCVVAELDPTHVCDGPSEADHIGGIGERGKGMKCPDDETIPLCPSAHRDRGGRAGYFEGWSTVDMRAWADTQIARYQLRYRELGAGADQLAILF